MSSNFDEQYFRGLRRIGSFVNKSAYSSEPFEILLVATTILNMHSLGRAPGLHWQYLGVSGNPSWSHYLRLGSVHTAPLPNEFIRFVDICQPVILLCFCAKIQIKIIVFVGLHSSQQRRKNIRSCGFTFSNAVVQTNIHFVRSHLPTAFFQTSVYVNIYLEGRSCKPLFFVRFHKNGGLGVRFCTKTEQCERGIT